MKLMTQTLSIDKAPYSQINHVFYNLWKEIDLVFSKWFSFCYCSGGMLVQIQGISILFFHKDLKKLLQQMIADISSIPYLMDGQFLLLCSLCHMIIFLIAQKPKTDWVVEQNDSGRLVWAQGKSPAWGKALYE